jgi:hypothetical protein
MPVVNNNAFITTATFDIGTDTHTSAIQSFQIVPTTPTASAVDLSGASRAFAGKSTFVLNLTMFQDWTATGLAKLFFTGEGTTAVIKIKLPGTQGVWTLNAILVAPPIGGDTNALATAQVSLPIVGVPVWSAT